METTPCGKCGAAVPTSNLTLHSLRCTGPKRPREPEAATPSATKVPEVVTVSSNKVARRAPEETGLRRGIDCMARKLSLKDWADGWTDARLAQLATELDAVDVQWKRANFEGNREKAGFGFPDYSPAESAWAGAARQQNLGCVIPAVRGMLEVLANVHGSDAVLPSSIFACRYANGATYCKNHVHYCRQITLSIGAPRTMFVDGAGVPAGGVHVVMRSGDCVILDGQKHGVAAEQAGTRFSLNLFYCTQEDIMTERRGRSEPAVSWPGGFKDPNRTFACKRCGMHHIVQGDDRTRRCPDDAVALDAGWNAGFGIA